MVGQVEQETLPAQACPVVGTLTTTAPACHHPFITMPACTGRRCSLLPVCWFLLPHSAFLPCLFTCAFPPILTCNSLFLMPWT